MLVNILKIISLLILSLNLIVQGCMLLAAGAGAGAGAATVSYIKGELQTTYPTTLDKTWEATLAALRDLDVKVVYTERDKISGNIEAKRNDGTKIKITLSQEGMGITLLKIRVGLFGDDTYSRAINSRIASRLGIK